MKVLLVLVFACAASASAGPARGPWMVDTTSTTTKICWRPKDAAQQCHQLLDLKPGATFQYTIPISAVVHTAKTLPPPGAPLRFIVVGDGGKATKGQFAVGGLIDTLDPDFILYVGDLVYPRGADVDYDAKWFEPYARTLPRRPFFPVVGNHDYGNHKDATKGQAVFDESYARIFGRPKFYAFTAGDARFFVLDDNEAYKLKAAASMAEDGEQAKWLAGELAARTEKWGFAAAHIPFYAVSWGHGDNSLVRARLEPTLQKAKISAVFSGHEHIYQRSKPQGGVLHLVVGTGGGGLNFGGLRAPWLAEEEESYGVLLVELDEKGGRGAFHAIDGKVRDQFSFAAPEMP